MGEIRYNRETVSEIARGLQALSAMAGRYGSSFISTGQSRGYPSRALLSAANEVSGVARAEQELIGKIVDNIVQDVADLEKMDEEAARLMLRLGE